MIHPGRLDVITVVSCFCFFVGFFVGFYYNLFIYLYILFIYFKILKFNSVFVFVCGCLFWCVVVCFVLLFAVVFCWFCSL